MKKASWEYTCDWCLRVVTNDVETMPEGWKLVLIGTDNRGPSKWESKYHICGECYGSEVELIP